MDRSEFRILVADDDGMVRDMIVKLLTEQGYAVMTAHDGTTALHLLRIEDIHLVLTDLRMPGADGMEVLRTAMQINPKISVVILTAYGTIDTALEAVREGAYDYIAKPFVMQQMLLVVRNAYKMALMCRENEKLLSQLKEACRPSENTDAPKEKVPDNGKQVDAIGRIDKLKDLNLINDEEARLLKSRAVSGQDDIKKYSLLVNDLKKKY